MPRQTINTGTIANDGTGDTLRQAATKINQNFQELYALYGGDSITASLFTVLTDSGLDILSSVYRTKIGVEALTVNRNVDFPNASGTIVLNNHTQTLVNKTLTEPRVNAPQIQNLKIFDNDTSNVYQIIPGALTSTQNINIPSLSDSDAFVLAAQSQTLTNKTIVVPTIRNPIIHGHLRDSANADMIHFTSVSSAVNHIDVTNGATGGHPKLSVEGADTNINIDLAGAGTGAVRSRTKLAYSSTTVTADGTIAANTPTLVICNKGSTLALALADGTVTGEIKIFTNRGAGTAQISSAKFLAGSRIDVAQYGAVTVLWDGANWYVTGYSSTSEVTIQP